MAVERSFLSMASSPLRFQASASEAAFMIRAVSASPPIESISKLNSTAIAAAKNAIANNNPRCSFMAFSFLEKKMTVYPEVLPMR